MAHGRCEEAMAAVPQGVRRVPDNTIDKSA
jgi:hypothetical protein